MHKFLEIALIASAGLLLASQAEARPSFFHAGGVSGVAGARGVAGRAHGTYVGSDGSTTHASAGGFRGTNGSSGYRASSTTAGADGSLSHQGSAAASGARGSVESSNSFTRSADGTWSGSSATSGTNAQTGNSYSGSTTIDPATGKPVHTGTCTNVSGAVISC